MATSTSKLVVFRFEDHDTANEALHTITELEKKNLIDLEDVALVLRNEKGKVKVRQTSDVTTGQGAWVGGWWGLLIGLIFWAPVAWGLMGAAMGALWGKVTDLGISDDFMKKIGHEIKPGNAALFALVRSAVFDKVVDQLKGFHGEVYYTSLPKDAERKLKKALVGKK